MGLRSWFRGKLAAEDEGANESVLRLVERVKASPVEEVEWLAAPERPTEQALRAWSAATQVVLPDDFVAFTTLHFNGLRLEARPAFWPRVRPGTPAPYWKMLRGVVVFGLGTSVEASRRLEVQASLGRASAHGPVPLLKRIGDAELIGVTASGEWVEWMPQAPAAPRRCAQQSFADLLESELDSLQDRLQRIREAA